MKSFVLTNVLFGIGFFAYLYVTSHWTVQFQTKELRIFFNRISLVFILVPLFILSFFSKPPFITLGEKWAVVVTSLGFGLQHYSLGIPWVICISFSIGGMFYGGITIKSGSIIPSIIWHIALNTLMVLSGLILK